EAVWAYATEVNVDFIKVNYVTSSDATLTREYDRFFLLMGDSHVFFAKYSF
ncbi:hypothetical protein ACJX0J_013715, partial [Zea mays]